jgi:hypothetical protein
MRLFQRIGLAGVTAAGVLTFVAAPANASTVHVVAPGQSIQAAVDAAHPGDTIVLRSGNYAGGVVISKDRITIRGAGRSTVVSDTGTNNCIPVAGPSGFCVTRAYGTVRGVTIKNLEVTGFAAFGVFGSGTDRLAVTGVAAIDNGEYGITEFDSTRGYFVGNYVSGTAEDAGLYVGDTPNAHGTIVAHNISVGNVLGVLVRHAHNVNVVHNIFIGNCIGVGLVDDGQPGGQGHTSVTHNVIKANNRTCAADAEHPPLGGSGVVILGGQHDTVRANVIIRNQGTTVWAGGVVILPGVGGNPAEHNKVTFNVIKKNEPADVIDNSGSTNNVIEHNICGTSQPDGLC